jgi:hypothetical protein
VFCVDLLIIAPSANARICNAHGPTLVGLCAKYFSLHFNNPCSLLVSFLHSKVVLLQSHILALFVFLLLSDV